MKTRQIFVNNNGEGIVAALDETENFSGYNHLAKQDALNVRLLSEETLGMVRAITGEFSALFWIEGDENSCEIHLHAKTEMNRGKRSDLLSVSTTGKNMAAKTLMGKIRDLIEVSLENYESVDQLQMKYGKMGSLAYGNWGMESMEGSSTAVAQSWSLAEYKKDVHDAMGENQFADQAWDELEKSIVAKLADNVRVGIKSDEVQLIIYKKF